MTMDIAKRAIRGMVGEGATILEIGAHSGLDTWRFLHPEGGRARQVVAFEPDPRPLARFRKILAQQIVDGSVILYPCAAGRINGRIPWFASHGKPWFAQKDITNIHNDWDSSGSLHQPTGHKELYPDVTFTQESVPCLRLDDIWLPHFDFAWIDVQGSQRDVIAGGHETLDRIPWIFIECHEEPLYDGEPTLPELCELLPQHAVVDKCNVNILFRKK